MKCGKKIESFCNTASFDWVQTTLFFLLFLWFAVNMECCHSHGYKVVMYLPKWSPAFVAFRLRTNTNCIGITLSWPCSLHWTIFHRSRLQINLKDKIGTHIIQSNSLFLFLFTRANDHHKWPKQNNKHSYQFNGIWTLIQLEKQLNWIEWSELSKRDFWYKRTQLIALAVRTAGIQCKLWCAKRVLWFEIQRFRWMSQQIWTIKKCSLLKRMYANQQKLKTVIHPTVSLLKSPVWCCKGDFSCPTDVYVVSQSIYSNDECCQLYDQERVMKTCWHQSSNILVELSKSSKRILPQHKR